MPRKPRFNLIGIPQHVIQRSNNREHCFYAEEDYRRSTTKIESNSIHRKPLLGPYAGVGAPTEFMVD